MVEYWKLAVHLYACFAVMVRICSTQFPCVSEPGSVQYTECAWIARHHIGLALITQPCLLLFKAVTLPCLLTRSRPGGRGCWNAAQVASTTLFKPRLRPTAGHMLRGSPVGAFVVDLVLGAVVAFLVPMVLTLLWEVRALRLSACMGESKQACLGQCSRLPLGIARQQVSLQTHLHQVC